MADWDQIPVFYLDKEKIVATIEGAIAEMKETLYPIGSVYLNILTDDNPADLGLPGTWEALEDGNLPDLAYSWKRTE